MNTTNLTVEQLKWTANDAMEAERFCREMATAEALAKCEQYLDVVNACSAELARRARRAA